jgi:hypothetical protein
MRPNNGKNMASKIDSKIKSAISRYGSMNESADSIRDLRSGWRHTGALQYAKYHSTEGVYTIGMGGPPVVGR